MGNAYILNGKAVCAEKMAVIVGEKLIEAGIINRPLKIRPYRGDVGLKSFCFINDGQSSVIASGCGSYNELLKNPEWVPPEWLPSDIWETVSKKFTAPHGINFCLTRHLSPYILDKLNTMTTEEVIKMVKPVLERERICFIAARRTAGKVYYFDENEVYCEAKHEDAPPLHRATPLTKIHFFRTSVWRKASTQIEPGMTFDECLKLFLEITMEHKPPPVVTELDQLVQNISNPIFEARDYIDGGPCTSITITIYLPRYIFETWQLLREAITRNRMELYNLVLDKISSSDCEQKCGCPANELILQKVTLCRDRTLEYRFLVPENKQIPRKTYYAKKKEEEN